MLGIYNYLRLTLFIREDPEDSDRFYLEVEMSIDEIEKQFLVEKKGRGLVYSMVEPVDTSLAPVMKDPKNGEEYLQVEPVGKGKRIIEDPQCKGSSLEVQPISERVIEDPKKKGQFLKVVSKQYVVYPHPKKKGQFVQRIAEQEGTIEHPEKKGKFLRVVQAHFKDEDAESSEGEDDDSVYGR